MKMNLATDFHVQTDKILYHGSILKLKIEHVVRKFDPTYMPVLLKSLIHKLYDTHEA